MTKRILATMLAVGMVSIAAFSFTAAVPLAEATPPTFGGGVNAFQNVIVPETAKNDLRDTIIRVLNIILGFLGLIAVIIILAAGFMWMTAGGNEKRLETARKLLIQGFIGLILILAAWAIAYFVVTTFKEQLLGGII